MALTTEVIHWLGIEGMSDDAAHWGTLKGLRAKGYGLHFCRGFDGKQCVEIQFHQEGSQSFGVMQGSGDTDAEALWNAAVKLYDFFQQWNREPPA